MVQRPPQPQPRAGQGQARQGGQQQGVAQQEEAQQLPDAAPAVAPGRGTRQTVHADLGHDDHHIGGQGGQTGHHHGLMVARQQAGHDGQAHEGRVAGAAGQAGDDGRARAPPGKQPVHDIAQQIAQHLRPDDAQPETAVGQVQTARPGQDVQHEHGQGQLEHIKAHGRAGVLRQHVGHVDSGPHGYEQKDGKNGIKRFHWIPPQTVVWLPGDVACGAEKDALLPSACPENCLFNQTIYNSLKKPGIGMPTGLSCAAGCRFGAPAPGRTAKGLPGRLRYGPADASAR